MFEICIFPYSEGLDILTFLLCILSITFIYRFFGILGLYAYNVVATIASNIQVMNIAKYSYIADTMALGTVVFSTIFIVDSIIIEKHGGKYARLGLLISMSSYLLFSALMYITMLYKPSAESTATSSAINTVFSQSGFIFISSLAAYFISQLSEIYLYTFIKSFLPNKALWIRYNLANAGAMLIDQLIFSLLCWKVFQKSDVGLDYIFKNYVMFNYFIRITISIVSTPLAYLIRKVKYKKINV